MRRADQLIANDELGQRAGPLQNLARMQRRVHACTGDAGAGVGDVRDRLRRPGHQRAQERVIAQRWGQNERTLGRVRLGVEQQVGDVDGADAIDEAVMGLVGDRPSTFGQPLDQRHFPQRASPVEPVRIEVSRPRAQLLVSAGRRQGDVGDMVTNPEAIVVGPARPGEPARPGR